MPRNAHAPQIPTLTAKAPTLKAKLNGFPAVNRGMGGVLRKAGAAVVNTINATLAMATSSSLRADGPLQNFFLQDPAGTYGIFANPYAGHYLQIDYGTPVKVVRTTYCNPHGGQWAPTQVLIQSSNNGTTWTTEATYADNDSSSIQTITIGTNKVARYWRVYQATNSRNGGSGYDWHFNCFSMVGQY